MNINEKIRLKNECKDCLILAAASLTQVDTNSLAFALAQTAHALHLISQIDHDDIAKYKVIEYLNAIKERERV